MKNGKLFFSCGKQGNMLYCNLFLGVCLVRMDLRDGRFSVLEGMQGPVGTDWWGGTDYLFLEDKLYIVSNRLSQVAEYSLSQDECSYWPIEEPCFALSCPNYSLCLLQGDKIYIFPRFDDVLRIFDINAHAVTEHRYLPLDDSYRYEEGSEADGALVSYALLADNAVWLFSRKKPVAWRYSLLSHEVDEQISLGECRGCVSAAWHGGAFYLLDGEGDVYVWTGRGAERLCRTGKKDGYFFRIAVTKKHIWLLPSMGDDILRYDFSTGRLEVYQDLPKDFRYTLIFPVQAKFYQGCEDASHYYFTMCASSHMLILDKDTGEARWLCPEYRSWEDWCKHVRLAYGNIIREQESFDLQDFWKLVGHTFKDGRKIPLSAGQEIWNRVARSVGI